MQVPTILFCRAMLALLLLCTDGAAHARGAVPIQEGLALHLLNRLAYGPAPGEVERVRAMGVHAYLDSQLAPAPGGGPVRDPGSSSGEDALLRAVASPRQLEEVLVAFWMAQFDTREDAARAALRSKVLGRYAALGRGRPPGSEREARQTLVRHFVSAPSAGLQRSVARVWRKTEGDQRAVLRALLTSREFLAPAQWNSKQKDGFRFVVSAVRASGVAVENVAPLAEFVREPLAADARARFVEQLVEGRLALAKAPVLPQDSASSAPPLRATVPGDPAQGRVSRPGSVLMAAPTPSAAAMAAAARSRPSAPGRLRELLGSEAFLRY